MEMFCIDSELMYLIVQKGFKLKLLIYSCIYFKSMWLIVMTVPCLTLWDHVKVASIPYLVVYKKCEVECS